MANRKKVTLETEFKHNFIVEADGRTLYTCPVEIKSQADLDNYGITWDDCQTLNFHGSEKVTVYFMKVESRALAEYQWSYLNSKHSCKLNSAMCMIPGKWKQWVRCPDSVFCAKCPHNADCKHPSSRGISSSLRVTSRRTEPPWTSRLWPSWNTKLSAT